MNLALIVKWYYADDLSRFSWDTNDSGKEHGELHNRRSQLDANVIR